MDGFTFTIELLKALVWPSTAILFVVLLKRPIIEIVPLMRKLKYKELELEFTQELQDLKSDAAEALSKEDECQSIKPNASKALDLVSYSTRAAIIEAWIELETVAVEVASSFWNQNTSDVFKNNSKLGEYLYQCKVLDENQLKIYKKLQHLRNKSAHVEELNLSERDAREYVEMANNLTCHIKRA